MLVVSLGCTLQILASLRVFGAECHYICPFWYHFGLFIKKFTKTTVTLRKRKSPLGVSRSQCKFQPHPHWSSLGVYFKLSTSIPVTFKNMVAPPPPALNFPKPASKLSIFCWAKRKARERVSGPFACWSCATSRDSPKWRACAQTIAPPALSKHYSTPNVGIMVKIVGLVFL